MPPEPECTCEQIDADQFNASGCELHNPASPWNTRQRDLACEDLSEL